MRLLMPWFVVCALTGCTIFNAPQRPDAAPDTGPDADAGTDADSGIDSSMDADAGDADGGDTGIPEICGNSEDDDDDGYTDCADLDCASDESCCESSGATAAPDVVEWPEMVPTMTFDIPAGSAEGDDDGILRFDELPTTVVAKDCISLAQGSEVTIEFLPSAPPRTSGYAAVVLSPIKTPSTVTGRLAPELVVEFTHDGSEGILVARNGNRVVGESEPFNLGTRPFEVEISFEIGLSEAGRAGLNAEISADDGRTLDVSLPAAFIDLENLVREPGSDCAAVPGLFLAIEGADEAVGVGEFSASAASCANPSVFQPLPLLPPLTTDGDSGTVDLGWGAAETGDIADEWADGGLSDPAIYSVFTEGAPLWHVLASTSDLDNRLQPFASTSVVVGHSTLFDTDWDSREVTEEGVNPRLAEQSEEVPPISCRLGVGACPPLARFRDPHVAQSGTSHVVSYVYETSPGVSELGMLVLESAALGNVDRPMDTSLNVLVQRGSSDPLVDVGDGPVADPVVVRIDDRGDDRDRAFWLFFRSGLDDGATVQYTTIVQTGSGYTATEPRVFLTADQLGVEAIDDFDILRDVVDGESFLRVWAFAYVGSQPQIVLALGNADNTMTPPTMAPYPANPVFTEDDLCAVSGGCRLVGFGLSRTPANDGGFTPILRFLMASEVPRSDVGMRYELVPFEQNWQLGLPPEE